MLQGDSLVMLSMQIEEAPPALRSSVQHRENAHKSGELAGCRRPPLLHHQVIHDSRRARRLHLLIRPPVSTGKEGAAAFESGTVQSHRDHHQQARRYREGVSRAVRQQ